MPVYSAIEMQDLPWPCYECPQKFRTAALLQNHLNEHDEDDGNNSVLDIDDGDDSHVDSMSRRRTRRQDTKSTSQDVTQATEAQQQDGQSKMVNYATTLHTACISYTQVRDEEFDLVYQFLKDTNALL